MAVADFNLSATVSDFPEGGTASGFNQSFQTTQAVGDWHTTSATTAGTVGVLLPTSASAIFVVPTESTNTNPFLAGFTSGRVGGIRLSPQNPSLVSINVAVPSTLHLWTTATEPVNVRVGVF